jgi:hypothetical protein
MRPRAILRIGVGLTVLFASGCSAAPERPQAGDSWQIEAVDLSGANGTITVERGAIIAMPERVRFVPDASHGILVHISYAPDRPNDAGYGAFDWGARLAREEDEFESGMLPRVLPLLEAVDWPVEPFLGTKLPESADPLAGWMVIAVSPDELAQEILLTYQPHLDRVQNGGFEARPVTDILIHAP